MQTAGKQATWLKARALAIVAGAAAASRLSSPAPPPRTLEGVASLLGSSVQGFVRPGDFIWERNESVLTEALRGRFVLFLASKAPQAPRDLYRARVRVSLEGHPIAVTEVHNLTSTPLGDETALAADGPFAQRYAAFASTAYGSIAAITLLDLSGDGGIVGAKNFVERWLGALGNLFDVGELSGIGKTNLLFENPVPRVKLGFDRGKLVLSMPDGKATSLDLATRALDRPDEAGIALQPMPHLRKAPILWAVDTVRGVVGPGPIAWLEDTFFGARDVVRRTGHTLTSKKEEVRVQAEEAPPSPPLDASAAGDDGGYWPPPRLPSIWQSPEPEEGAWQPVDHPFLKRLSNADKAPPYCYTTWVKPDAKRPYAKVLIVALDMRQLEINMEGGVEDPAPLTGTKSFGRIPREPEILGRVVGAFNGAFKTTHGAYGMMVNRRVLLPPKPEAATVVVTADHRVGMGSWPQSEDLPDNIISFRQNLDPLVSGSQFNPTGRQQWGFQLAGHSVLTERSGICVTRPGHFMYLWGDDVSGPALGKAMVQAGCAYGMHLDMNPKHTGFVFADIRDVKKKDYDAKLLTPQMEILPERYIEWSPKDFFYVMLRDLGEPPLSGEHAVKWAPDGGSQPAPAWLPGAHGAETQALGVKVELFGIDAGRVIYRARPGRGDAEGKGIDLPEDEARRVIAAFGLGNPRRPKGLGLKRAGKVEYPWKGGLTGYLAMGPEGELSIGPGDAPAAAPDAIELPLLVTNGNMTLYAEGSGPTRLRTAACVLPSGRATFAVSNASSDAPNATALAKQGCRHAVALDRGSHDDSFFQRAGKSSAPVARSEQTTLYAVAQPMRPRAFEWKP